MAEAAGVRRKGRRLHPRLDEEEGPKKMTSKPKTIPIPTIQTAAIRIRSETRAGTEIVEAARVVTGAGDEKEIPTNRTTVMRAMILAVRGRSLPER